MAKRLEFHWIPFFKYSLVLSVYVFAGGMLLFHLEECSYNAEESERKHSKLLAGNITAFCVTLAETAVDTFNVSNAEMAQNKVFIDNCLRLVSQEKVYLVGYDSLKCKWHWTNLRKWIRFASNSLATIGYPDLNIYSQVGKIFFICYMILGIPLSALCYIHFGRIIRVIFRKFIRKVEGHFFNRAEPRNIRHKVLFYNSVTIIFIIIVPAIIVKSKGKESWTLIDCLYYFMGVVSTSGNEHLKIDSGFFILNTGLSVLIDSCQVLSLGLVSSLIQAGASFHRAKHKRSRLPLHRHAEKKQEDVEPQNGVVNGTVAMDSLVILVRQDGDTELS